MKISCLLIAVLLCAVGGLVVVNFRADARSRIEREALTARTSELGRLRAENQRLTKTVADLEAAQVASKGYYSELLKLRGEVSSLKKLKDAPSKTASSKPAPAIAVAPAPDPVPAEPAAPEPIPRDQWKFSGFNTPENALQSVAWAMNSGNLPVFMGSLTPKAQEAMAAQLDGKSQEEIAAYLREETRDLAALRFDHKSVSAEGDVSFVVAARQEDNGGVVTRDESVIKLRNINGEWKFALDE